MPAKKKTANKGLLTDDFRRTFFLLVIEFTRQLIITSLNRPDLRQSEMTNMARMASDAPGSLQAIPDDQVRYWNSYVGRVSYQTNRASDTFRFLLGRLNNAMATIDSATTPMDIMRVNAEIRHFLLRARCGIIALVQPSEDGEYDVDVLPLLLPEREEPRRLVFASNPAHTYCNTALTETVDIMRNHGHMPGRELLQAHSTANANISALHNALLLWSEELKNFMDQACIPKNRESDFKDTARKLSLCSAQIGDILRFMDATENLVWDLIDPGYLQQYDPIPDDPIPVDPIPDDPIPVDLIPNDPIPVDPIQDDEAGSDKTLTYEYEDPVARDGYESGDTLSYDGDWDGDRLDHVPEDRDGLDHVPDLDRRTATTRRARLAPLSPEEAQRQEEELAARIRAVELEEDVEPVIPPPPQEEMQSLDEDESKLLSNHTKQMIEFMEEFTAKEMQKNVLVMKKEAQMQARSAEAARKSRALLKEVIKAAQVAHGKYQMLADNYLYICSFRRLLPIQQNPIRINERGWFGRLFTWGSGTNMVWYNQHGTEVSDLAAPGEITDASLPIFDSQNPNPIIEGPNGSWGVRFINPDGTSFIQWYDHAGIRILD